MRSQFGGCFRKSGAARGAAIALNMPLSVGSEPLGVVLASLTGHGFSPLAFLRRKPENWCGSDSRAQSAFRISPAPGSSRRRGAYITASVYGGRIATVGLLSEPRSGSHPLCGFALVANSFLLRLLLQHSGEGSRVGVEDSCPPVNFAMRWRSSGQRRTGGKRWQVLFGGFRNCSHHKVP